MNLVLTLAAAAVLCTCSEPPRNIPDSMAVVQAPALRDTIRLSATRPTARVRVDPRQFSNTSLLSFTVAVAANPDGAEMDIAAAVVVGDRERGLPVGRISLYPVDRGGVFSLRLPASVASELNKAAAADSAVAITLTLLPSERARGTPDRRALSITNVRLRSP